MKGLELSRLFYEEAVKPLLEADFAELMPRIAAGLSGEGSQCFGFDDEISQDHDWGASICLWLTAEDYARYGQSLQQALYNLPRGFRGYPVSWVPGRNGVLEIGAFYKKYLAVDAVPQTIGQWLHIPEHHLAVATNGEVFADPFGQFSAVREELKKGYPEDIRKKLLAGRCMNMAQSGQYNYPRVLSRGDKTAALLTEAEFIRNACSAVYLLNNRYAPFYKWMAHGLKTLPNLGQAVAEKLEALTAYPHPGVQAEDYYVGKIQIMQEICNLLIAELRRQGLSDSFDASLIEHGLQVHSRIVHEGLRLTSPWLQ